MTGLVAVLLWLSVIGVVGYGWVLNILWIVHQTAIVWSGEMIISAVGVFIVPLGSIMGLFVH